jgi:alkanesulfonate monooxygenase SsuD/methylene tetrahydromethanopterin reductase-like flavin-dependent oxidoreductase (luciferase family)
MSGIPLSVLDLVPISSGSTASEALANTVDLARCAEAAGYERYWIAEHHLNPGVAGTSPAVVMSLVAGATRRLRVGSGAVQTGHRTALSIVEEFGLLDAAFPGRVDLGLGRSGARRPPTGNGASEGAASGAGAAVLDERELLAVGADGHRRTAGGLVIPEPFSFGALLRSPRFAVQAALLRQPGAEPLPYTEQVEMLLALLGGTYRSAEGVEAHPVPGESAGLEVWITGSSGGESAQLAGRHGLPFAANYHVAPAAVLDAVAAYRRAFRPALGGLPAPRVMVSADAVVASTDEEARWLASGYGLWCAASAPGRGPSRSPRPRKRWRTSGPTRTGRSSPTAWPRSSWARRPRSPPGWRSWPPRPAPTSCWSRRSPTTTPTAAAPSTCSPASGTDDLVPAQERPAQDR